MVFSSFVFLGFYLPLILLLYFGVLNITHSVRIANRVLLLGSLFFYTWGEPRWFVLLLIIATSDYFIGRKIHAADNIATRKRLVATSLTMDLSILFVFKYLGFTVATINRLPSADFIRPDIALPIGISFFIFQSLSYIMDLYSNKIKAPEQYLNFLLYVGMFPQLVAGPIIRYSDISHQLQDRHTSLSDFSLGIRRFSVGLSKKIILANSFGAAVVILFGDDLTSLSMLAAWLGVLFFAFQIYFDFSGYSDMAIGLGRMFGFTYKENFNYPYIADSVTEFWRRWHMSLGSFFRDYVYIPLGGNRRSQFRNIFIVWFLTGLWHGASWNFVLWGLYFGVFLFIEKWMRSKNFPVPRPVTWFVTMLLVLYGWGIFYFTDSSSLMEFSQSFFGMKELYDSQYLKVMTVLTDNVWLLAVGAAAATPLPRILYHKYITGPFAFLWNIIVIPAVLTVSFIFLVGESYNPFLYFRF